MRKAASVARVILAFLFTVSYCLVMLPVGLVLLPWRAARIRAFGVMSRKLGSGVIRIAGVTLRVKNEDRLRGSFPAIYVSNHVSAFDVFLGMALCPVGGIGVMTSGVSRVPGYGLAYQISGHAIVDRSKARSSVNVLHEVAMLAKENGLGVWILPEGGRSDDGRLRRFKAGFVQIAIETGLPVVPVVLHGVHRLWSRKRFPTLAEREIDVEVLPPIDTREWRNETRREHAAQVQAIFAAALRDDQRPL